MGGVKAKFNPAQVRVWADSTGVFWYCWQPIYLRLIGAMVFALALVLTSALAFYIARTRSDLVEFPSPIQVRC